MCVVQVPGAHNCDNKALYFEWLKAYYMVTRYTITTAWYSVICNTLPAKFAIQ